jgi:hypothetical protein
MVLHLETIEIRRIDLPVPAFGIGMKEHRQRIVCGYMS